MRIQAKVFACAICLVLAACGGGGGSGANPPPPSAPPPPPPPATYTIGGTVSGLTGTVVLQNNGANNLSIAATGAFTFGTAVVSGTAYSVTVLTQPAGQTCNASNGSGSVGATNVTTITVTCVDNPLVFLNSTPPSGSTNAERNQTRMLIFDRPLNAATVSGAVSLTSAAGPEPMVAAASGAVATITTWRPLLPMALYTMSASTALQGSNGELLANAVNATFTTRDGTWQATTRVRPTALPIGYSDTSASLITDANGNAMLVWVQQVDGLFGEVVARRYQPATGWGEQQTIETAIGDANSTALAVDAAGNVTAVWRLWSGGVHSARANRFTVNGTGGSWGTPISLEDSSLTVNEVAVAANAGGAVMVIFGRTDSVRTNLWATRYSGGTWSAPELVETINSNDVSDIAIAGDAQDDFVAVWRHMDAGFLNIWQNRFSSTSWGSAALLESGNAGNAYPPQIAMDADGTAAVVWAYDNGANRQMIANRYLPGSGWSGPRVLDTTGVAPGRSVAVGFDNTGRAHASWICDQGARVCISSFGVGGTGWNAPDASTVTTASPTGGFRMTVDASGHVMTTWMTQASLLVGGVQTYTVRATAMRYLSNAGGWSATEFLDALETYSTAPGNDERLRPVVEASGSVMAVWPDATRNLVYKRFE